MALIVAAPAVSAIPAKAGRTINDLLPDEMLSRIFTAGSEEFAFHFIPSSTRLVPAPSYDREISPKYIRAMKPFASLAAIVCRRWRDLVDAKRNHHLWVTRVTLSNEGRIQGDGGLGFGDIAVQFSKFKSALEHSDRSDLEVYWHVRGEPYEQYSSHLTDPSIGLLARGLQLVLPYAGQLRWFNAVVNSDAMLGFVAHFLNCLGRTPRLEWIEISRLVGKEDPLRWSSPEAFLRLLNLDLTFVPAKKSTLLGFPEDEKLESLSHFQSYGIAPLENILMPPGLINAVMEETSSEDVPLQWNGFVKAIYAHRMVQRLQVSFKHMEGEAVSIPSGSHQPLPFLRSLAVTADTYYARGFLGTFLTPNLVWLSITVSSGRDQLPPEALENISAPNLRFIFLRGDLIRCLKIITKVESPVLELLYITIVPPTFSDDPLDISLDFRTDYPPFISPKDIEIWSHYHHEALACLYLLDARKTQRISLVCSSGPSSMSPLAMLDSITVTKEYASPRPLLPQLREINCRGYAPRAISHILNNVEAPLLMTLGMETPNVHPYGQEIRWSPPTPHAMSIFRQITHFRTEMWWPVQPRWARIGHPLKYFYGLEEVTIINVYRSEVLLWFRDGFLGDEALGVEEWAKMKLRTLKIVFSEVRLPDTVVPPGWRYAVEGVSAWRKKNDLPPIEFVFIHTYVE